MGSKLTFWRNVFYKSDIHTVAPWCLDRRLDGRAGSSELNWSHTRSLMALYVLKLCELAIAQAALLEGHT